MKNKGLLAAVLAAFTLTACGPSATVLDVDMRVPSKSGLDLAGKSMAVVYLEDPSGRDSVFNGNMAEGFATELEKSYFDGEKAIQLYKLPKDPDGDYSDRDTLIHLVMQTDDDVIFLFDSPDFGDVRVTRGPSALESKDSSILATATIPYTIKLYAYDSRSGSDSVRIFSGNASTKEHLFASDDEGDHLIASRVFSGLAKQGMTTGELSAGKFKSQWREESFVLYYYEETAWEQALDNAFDMKWREAMKSWMSLAGTNNVRRRSCACYNMAVGCFMLGEKDLALKWLDQSDKDYKLSASDYLRNRIRSK